MQINQNNLSCMSQEIHIPRVSVGMPVYNGEKFIREAINSLLSQTFTDFELIISDNASTDGTEAICREYAEKDSRILYVRQPENRGGPANFNFVLDCARGKYFSWLAHDDFMDETYFDVLVQYLDEHPEVVLCSTDVKVIRSGNDLRTIKLEILREQSEWSSSRRHIFTYSSDITILIYGVYRVDVLRRHCNLGGLKFMGMLWGIEFILLPKIALQGIIVALPLPLRTYRIHDESGAQQELSHTRPILRLFNMIYIILRYQACTVAFSRLAVREKMKIISAMCYYDLPVLLLYIIDCIPVRYRQSLSRRKWLCALKHRFLH